MRAEDCVVSECPRKASGRVPMVPMCNYHALQIAMLFRSDVLAVAEREQVDASTQRAEAKAARSGNREGALVYYAQIGNYIKIGFSTRLQARMRTLRVDKLLAIEPGGPELERQRHIDFAAERVDLRRENFRASPALLGHISETRQKYGLPLWATRPRTSEVTIRKVAK